ncbi:MAG: phosphate acyltransferase PlsX [Clostridia bacterium]|nr:phosphate acyltransferase PlsX [Clostridia bacterium]
MKLIIDCLGGDRSPEANIEGSLKALACYDDLELVLCGDKDVIEQYLARNAAPDALLRITVVHAPTVITGDDKPTDAIRLKKDSSMMSAIKLLREDEAIGGIVSTGATGSLIAAATLRIGRIPGVIRPAFCPILPTMDGSVVGLCDSGANVDCSARMLVQFAIMASAYIRINFGKGSPRVALLNIGTEAEKGDDLRRETYELLSKIPFINFVGNMESRDLISGKYDLVVADGFSGNVLVKATEGTALQLLKKIKKDILSKNVYKLGALFMKKMFEEEKEFMNYQNYGGSVLLGTEKVIVKGHGSSDEAAVFACIRQCYTMATSDLRNVIREEIERSESFIEKLEEKSE